VLLEQHEPKDIMLVGHFPQMPQLLAQLIGPGAESRQSSLPINGMVALENLDGRWIERWRLEAGEREGEGA
jgi:phosphohistidine phosphatase SixA